MLFVETSYFVLCCSLLLCLPLRDVVCRNKLFCIVLLTIVMPTLMDVVCRNKLFCIVLLTIVMSSLEGCCL